MEEKEKEIEHIISFLKKRGFESNDLSIKIKEYVDKDFPIFWLEHQKDFDGERMKFRICLVKKNENGHYALTEIAATHRLPVDIDPGTINGVDIAALEQRMHEIDWKYWWSEKTSGTVAQKNLGKVPDIMKLLNHLIEGNEAAGKTAQQMLIYKYWPGQIYDLFYRPIGIDLRAAHEHRYDFELLDWPTVTAELAYLILSERIDSVANQLLELRLDKVTGPINEQELYKMLADNPEKFKLSGNFNTPEGFIEYEIPFEKTDSWYQLNTYSVNFTPYPEIKQGTFNGIDPVALEKMMREVNWKNDHELFIFHKDREPDFQPKVQDIQEQLYRLSTDMAGAEKADILQLKYLQDATFFEGNIPQSSWDLLEELPKWTYQFPKEMEIKSAINLFNGRPVLAPISTVMEEENRKWMRLEMQKDHEPEVVYVGEFSEGEIMDCLELLPIKSENYYSIRQSLILGNLNEIQLLNRDRIYLEANPEQKTLNLYTPEMRLIPFNLRFDPDWKPIKKGQAYSLSNEHTAQQIRQKNKQEKKSKKTKGKKI